MVISAREIRAVGGKCRPPLPSSWNPRFPSTRLSLNRFQMGNSSLTSVSFVRTQNSGDIRLLPGFSARPFRLGRFCLGFPAWTFQLGLSGLVIPTWAFRLGRSGSSGRVVVALRIRISSEIFASPRLGGYGLPDRNGSRNSFPKSRLKGAEDQNSSLIINYLIFI